MRHCLALLAVLLLMPMGHAEPDQLGSVLGSGADWWVMKDRRGQDVPAVLEHWDGRTVIVGQGRQTTLDSRAEIGAGTEIAVTFRLAGKGNCWARVNVGIKDPSARSDGVTCTVSARAGQDAILCSIPGVERRTYRGRKTYMTKWISQSSLGWPEYLRKLIEHDLAALPAVAEMWVTVRWQIFADGTRVYVDDRLLWEGKSADPDLSGKVRLAVSQGVGIAAVRVSDAARTTAPYEPVGLEGYVNASGFMGSRLDRASLPGPQVKVGRIPFQLPAPRANGNDHIDLEKSWLKSGFAGSRESPRPRNAGMGGRWGGAFQVDPARVQITVPGGRYRAIHLLAAADADKDQLPIVTAQFYRPTQGRPKNFTTRAPLFTAKSRVAALPAKLEDGRGGKLFLVTIPIDTGQLARFDDLEVLEIELTKEAKLYRAYPDPFFYSYHPAGLPSSVHLYAMTLERPAVDMTLESSAYAHSWAAPEKPLYTVRLRHEQAKAQNVTLAWTTTSNDGKETTKGTSKVSVPPGAEGMAAPIELDLKLHGTHVFKVTMKLGAHVWTEQRTLALLHADTRERGDWERRRGPIFGFWNWRGGHYTPPGYRQTYLMGLAGAESSSGSFGSKRTPDEERAVARQFKMATFKAFIAGDHYITAKFAGNLRKEGLEKARGNFIKRLRETETKPSDITRPLFLSFFPEPHIGMHTAGILPSYRGEPKSADFQFSEAEEDRFQLFLQGFIEGAKIVKEIFPHVKTNLPHGDPMFPVPFMQRSKEARELFDGIAVDIPCFERLPEQQLHQVSIHRMYICRKELAEAGVPDPWLPMYEGPSVPAQPGSLNLREHADISVRDSLILLAYGVDMQLGGWAPFDAGSYWGEQHYGGGMFRPLPLITPRPTYAAFASMTRHLNRRNFDGWAPTGSLSVYAMRFTHYRTREPVYALWTLRGTRPVTASAAGKVTVYDQMDNPTELTPVDGVVTFTVDSSPRYAHGLAADVKITLGEPDHSDAAPAKGAAKIAALGDGSWTLSTERDEHYEQSHDDFVRRFPGKMSIRSETAPRAAGGKALAVHLEKQDRDIRFMPFYTTLEPAKPVVIAGKASHLGLWVKAASDWGRVVYFLRDANGERWISVGTAGAWNCDDLHSWSAFCFDGWRYLRFELPAFSAYDNFRELGTSWWGSYGQGDDIADLPLTLEKIVVERRTHAMYVNDPQPTRPDDVLLGDLYAEYERPENKSPETVRLSRLRMPVPTNMPALGNPIEEMAQAGVAKASAITKITLPEQRADGTRCNVHFEPVPGAKQYDVWASPYPSGVGAIQLGKGWTESGKSIRGLRPDTDFHLFLVYTDADGKAAKPSAPFKIRLKDVFAMK